MARLRIRIELNRGGVGVPLHKLASVVDEAQKFFHMLAEDVRIEKAKGEWLGFDFDNESLNFTAEYVGHVTAEQVQAFYAAFDGTTPLRRGTIAQFACITEAIGEDELIGFGLFQSEEIEEPTEWRCLSRRDALRISDEIRLLADASGEFDQESHLPAVTDATIGARLFGDRRDRSFDQAKLTDYMREVESNLSKRITRVENELDGHSGQIQDLRTKSAATEESFRNLLSAVETFCDQATHQLQRISQPVTMAPGQPAALSPAKQPALPPAQPAALPPAPREERPRKLAGKWRPLVIAAAGLVVAIVFSGLLLWPTRPPELASPPVDQKVAAASPAAVPSPPPPVESPKPAAPRAMRIYVEASEPTWVSLTEADGNRLMVRMLEPGDTRTFELAKTVTLRTGNAGGLIVRLNGKSIGPLGPHGKVQEIEFKDGGFKIGSGD